MTISKTAWTRYYRRLRKVSDTAAAEALAWVEEHGLEDADALVNAMYGITSKYSTAAAALACEMYDAVAVASGVSVPAAEPATLFSRHAVEKEITKAVERAPSTVPEHVGRMTKQVANDTTLSNAARDGTEYAWIPNGDACAFCMMLASNGWQRASKKAANGAHAEHIHAHCDCQYAIRFNGKGGVSEYDPEKYKAVFEGIEGDDWTERVNAVRREQYKANADTINEQKRIAYAARTNKPIAYKFQEPDKNIVAFEKKYFTAKTEHAIITSPDGSVFGIYKGGKRGVKVESEPKQAGYTFSHNHPVPANFSVSDVRLFEQNGYKQIRAVTPNETYILEAIAPKRIDTSGGDTLAGAMFKKWTELDAESTKRRRELNAQVALISDREERTKAAIKVAEDIYDWRITEEDAWLNKNASLFGYRYTRRPH